MQLCQHKSRTTKITWYSLLKLNKYLKGSKYNALLGSLKCFLIYFSSRSLTFPESEGNELDVWGPLPPFMGVFPSPWRGTMHISGRFACLAPLLLLAVQRQEQQHLGKLMFILLGVTDIVGASKDFNQWWLMYLKI